MAEFADDSQSFKLSSLPFLTLASTNECTDTFEVLNNSVLNTPTFSLHRLMGFSSESFLPQQQQPEFPDPFVDNLWNFPNSVLAAQSVGYLGNENQENKKREATELSNAGSGKTSSQVSDNGSEEGEKINRKRCSGRNKRAKCNEKQEEGPKEVIHVRARRGQATDSHSLAERLRRERINKRMKCLRDLVPGCHQTMGMAVTLDEIINYVQSLKNQVEFLSMKLSAASSLYDFSSDMDSTGAFETTPSYIHSLYQTP